MTACLQAQNPLGLASHGNRSVLIYIPGPATSRFLRPVGVSNEVYRVPLLEFPESHIEDEIFSRDPYVLSIVMNLSRAGSRISQVHKFAKNESIRSQILLPAGRHTDSLARVARQYKWVSPIPEVARMREDTSGT